MKRKKLTLSDVMITLVLLLGGFVIFYPFYNSVLVSFMSEKEMMANPFAFYVKDFTLAAYKQIFSDDNIFIGYKNSLLIILFRLACLSALPLHMRYREISFYSAKQ